MSTRDALLNAALAAVDDEGWQAAGVRSVTARAGAPLGAVNYHFGSKEALFREAALAEIGLMFATPGRLMTGATDLGSLVTAMLAWSRDPDVTDRQRTLLLEVMAQSRRDEDLAAALGGALAGYRQALAEALSRVRGRAVEPDVADAFAAHCDGLWLHSVIDPTFRGEGAGAAAADAWVAALGRDSQHADGLRTDG